MKTFHVENSNNSWSLKACLLVYVAPLHTYLFRKSNSPCLCPYSLCWATWWWFHQCPSHWEDRQNSRRWRQREERWRWTKKEEAEAQGLWQEPQVGHVPHQTRRQCNFCPNQKRQVEGQYLPWFLCSRKEVQLPSDALQERQALHVEKTLIPLILSNDIGLLDN